MITRRKTKTIKIGNIYIGGNNPIAIQSMVKTKTIDIEETIKQIKALENTSCEIVRLAVKDSAEAKALKKIKASTRLPLVADIHFNWRIAIEAIDSGVDKIRLNPGNIYEVDHVRQIAKAAKQNRIPIRVGVNSGSLRKIKNPCLSGRQEQSRIKNIANTMVKEALDYIKILEDTGFYDTVISLKASNILDTLQAYRKISMVSDYPLHLGVTATGTSYMGIIKSSIAIGVLLLEGIGDTIRISLTDRPEQEVKAAKFILESIGLRSFGPEIISCPTCGRCEVDLLKIVRDLENKLSAIRYPLSAKPLKVAIMGCVVNGPGEAGQSDIGIAFGKKEGLLFRNGQAIKKVSFPDCITTLVKETEASIKCLKHTKIR